MKTRKKRFLSAACVLDKLLADGRLMEDLSEPGNGLRLLRKKYGNILFKLSDRKRNWVLWKLTQKGQLDICENFFYDPRGKEQYCMATNKSTTCDLIRDSSKCKIIKT